jgi:hypothetical protein
MTGGGGTSTFVIPKSTKVGSWGIVNVTDSTRLWEISDIVDVLEKLFWEAAHA